jgi:hypothetical protein
LQKKKKKLLTTLGDKDGNTHKKEICMGNRTKRTLGSVGVEKGIPVTITALPARSAKSRPSLTCESTKCINNGCALFMAWQNSYILKCAP